jgi:hypothetical protein
MRTKTFYSLHGVQLTGPISHEKRFKNKLITFVKKLGKIYATTDNYSLVEVEESTSMAVLESLILAEL